MGSWQRATTLHLLGGPIAVEQALPSVVAACWSPQMTMTFAVLWQRLGRPAGRYLSHRAAMLLVRQVLAAAGAPWDEWAHDVWAVNRIYHTLSELRRAGVTAETFKALPREADLHTFKPLLGAYEQRLEAAHFFDDSDVERHAVWAVTQGQWPIAFDVLTQVQVQGVAELIGARLDVLNAFAARGLSVRVLIPWDGQRTTTFAWPELGLHALEARAHPSIDIQFDDRIGGGQLAPLRQAQGSEAEVVHDAAATLHVYKSGSDEVRAGVAQIIQWWRQGVAPEDMAIVTPDMTGQGQKILDLCALIH